MRYGFLEQTPDHFLSDEDRFIFQTGITWFLTLLDKGIPLSEEALGFCLLTLNGRATSFIKKARKHITRVGPQKMPAHKFEQGLECFDDELDNYPNLSMTIGDFVKKCGTRLSRPLSEDLGEALRGRITDLASGKECMIEQGQKTLQSLFRLNDVEASIVTAVFMIDNCNALSDYFDSHLNCRELGRAKLLATLLNISQKDLHEALSGKISKLELIDASLNILSVDGTIELIFNRSVDSTKSLFYKEIKKDVLPMDYFPLEKDIADHILALLKTDNESPTHILLYGEPGAGKTSFAAAAAHALSQPAYSVTTPGNSDSGARKKSLEAILNMTQNGTEGLVVVDEADNLLNTRFAYIFSGEKQDKGWLNEFLERPGVRTIWITNDTHGIPDSVMRRFAYSVQFQKLGRDQRINIWKRVVTQNKVLSLVPQEQLKLFAARYPLSAGSIDLAIKKAKEIAGRKKSPFINAVEKSLKASQQLINGNNSVGKDDALEREYSLDGLNLDAEVPVLMHQLVAFNKYLNNDKTEMRVNMNLLFYGPPGTGKTEMSRYLSRRLKRELIVKRTSDLLSMYVGGSEQQIAEAFRQAERQRAVLVIDEADSLLFSRDKAQRSWETSMVNEFLTQMEHFRGLLICTTNRMEELDSASLRRFNHKIHFDYLKSDGALKFYERVLCPLTTQPATKEVLQPLHQLNNLTPGDFKIIRDRYAFYSKDKVRHSDLVKELVGESKIKECAGKRRAIGF